MMESLPLLTTTTHFHNKIIFYLPTLCRILISSSLLTAAEIEVVSINMDLFHYCRMISTLLLKATLTIDNDLVNNLFIKVYNKV